MSIDALHSRIRKLKSPIVVDLSLDPGTLPPILLEQEPNQTAAYGRFCRELMQSLVELVPALRFSFGQFALMGEEGLSLLRRLLQDARDLGYYVLLDSPELLSPLSSELTARQIFGKVAFFCDGLVLSPYIGSDAVKPFLPYCAEKQKDLFVILRSANKSALELQDLLTGSRHVHDAAAEMVSRMGENMLGKCGYSQIGGTVSAGKPGYLTTLRRKHDRVFLLIDGLEYASGNFKNASLAFDRFGYGAAVCVGTSVTAAWQETGGSGADYGALAVEAAKRVRKNIRNYVTIL